MADSFQILSNLLLANYPSSTWQIDSWYSNPQKSPRVLHNVHCSSQSLGSQHALSNAHRKSLQMVRHAAKLWNKKWDCVYSFQFHSKIKKQQPFLTPLPPPRMFCTPQVKSHFPVFTMNEFSWNSDRGSGRVQLKTFCCSLKRLQASLHIDGGRDRNVCIHLQLPMLWCVGPEPNYVYASLILRVIMLRYPNSFTERKIQTWRLCENFLRLSVRRHLMCHSRCTSASHSKMPPHNVADVAARNNQQGATCSP
jgi:hypothetical protein